MHPWTIGRRARRRVTTKKLNSMPTVTYMRQSTRVMKISSCEFMRRTFQAFIGSCLISTQLSPNRKHLFVVSKTIIVTCCRSTQAHQTVSVTNSALVLLDIECYEA